MSNPIISILHPTARIKPYPSFPRGWRAACDQFFHAAADPSQIEYVLIIHEAQWAEFWREFGFRVTSEECSDLVRVFSGVPAFGSFVVVRNHGRTFPLGDGGFAGCVVDQINAGAAASTGQLLIGIMDDLEAPERWDEKLLDCHPRDLPIEGRELVIDLTGESSDWIVYSAMTRARYERYGYVLHPDFESMYADNYYSEIAHRDGVVINGRHLGFKHNHPINGRSQTDEVYAQQNRPQAYAIGRATIGRLLHGTRVLAICLPGEGFRYEIAAAHSRMQNHLSQGQRFMVAEWRAHTTNVYVTRIEITKLLLEEKPHPDLVLWQDDDNPVTPEHFEMLLSDLDEHPELDGVVGWCWCDNDGEPGPDGKQKPWMMSCGRQREDLLCLRFTQDDFKTAIQSGKMLITSDDLAPDQFWSGFPVVLMRGETHRNLGWEAFKPMLIPEVKFGFTSEDTSFFLNAHRAGLKFAVDLRVQVPHMKFRAIAPAYIPESEKGKALQTRGLVPPDAVPVLV